MKTLLDRFGWKIFAGILFAGFVANIVDIFIKDNPPGVFDLLLLCMQVLCLIGIIGLAVNIGIFSRLVWKAAFGLNSFFLIYMCVITALALSNPITAPPGTTIPQFLSAMGWYFMELAIFTVTVYGLFVYAHRRNELWK